MKRKILAQLMSNNGTSIKQQLLNGAPFRLPLTHTAVPASAASGTTATFTRATASTWRNNDGYLVTGVAGEIGFVGARRVRNWIQAPTENWSSAGWTKSGISVSGNRLTATGANGVIYDSAALGMGTGRTAVGSVTLSRVTGTGNIDVSTNGGTTWTTVNVTGARVSVSLTGNINGQFAIRIVTSGDSVDATYPQLEDVTAQTTQTAGEYVSVGVPSDWAGDELVTNGTFDTDLSGWTLTQTATAGVPTWDAGSMKMNSDGSGFSRADQELVTTAGTGYVVSGILSGNAPLTITVGTSQGGTTLLNQNIGSTGLFTYRFTATGASTWIRLQDGGGTANSLDNISVKPALYHGSMVDGVKCFATDINGAAIPSSTLLGAQFEGARTNLCLQSNAFTTTWAATGTPAVTQNVVGPDGATSAWTLTDNDAGALEYITQSITLTAAPYTFSIFVGKTVGPQSSYPVIDFVTGTTIALATIDTTNGVATVWTAYTGLTMLASASARCVSYNDDFWRVELTATGTVAAYSFAILPAAASTPTQSTGVVATALTGSAVFYGAQVELGSFASSYIPTTTIAVARNADVLTYSSAGNIDGTKGWCYGEASSAFGTTSAVATILGFGSSAGVGNAGLAVWATAATAVSTSDGTTRVEKTGLTSLQNRIGNLASSWGGATQTITGDGATLASGAFDGDKSPTVIEVGTLGSANNWFGTIRNVRIGQRQLSASELQAITS